MTDASQRQEGGGVSLLFVVNAILRRRRTIVAAGLVGMVVAVFIVLLGPRTYVSSATFIPQGSASNMSALSLAASQFGIRVPSNDGSWDPVVYVELLGSRALLEPVAADTFMAADGEAAPLADLLEIEATTPALRIERAMRRLRGTIVTASEDPRLRAVHLSAATQWPDVSFAIVERLLDGVNEFNLRVRNSQAAAERRFVERQASEAERALRSAEDRLQQFLLTNRIAGTPTLRFEQDRLEREVALRQQVYTTLLQSLEEARMREVRDTPVITVIEAPVRPILPERRRTAVKGILGGLLGVFLAIGLAVGRELVAGARQAPGGEAREFFQLVREATPRLLRRSRAS